MSRASQGTHPPPLLDPKIARTVYDAYLETAEAFNEPGRFTALAG